MAGHGPKAALRASSDDTDARYRQGAQGTDTEHFQAGSRQTAKDHGRKPGVSLLVRSKFTLNSRPVSGRDLFGSLLPSNICRTRENHLNSFGDLFTVVGVTASELVDNS